MHRRLVLLLLVLAFFVQAACSSPSVCDDATGLSDTSLNPNGSKCTRICECNNQTHLGECVGGACVSFSREPCSAKGLERPCRLAAALVKDGCVDGVQICQPEGLKERYWGRCRADCACEPGKVEVCYGGSPATLNVGVCKAGNRVCRADKSWGPCNGEILPGSERCNGQDDDCNGKTDDNCTPPSEATDEKPPEASVEKPTDASGEKPSEASVEKPSDASVEPVTTPEESGAREPALDLDEAPDTISEPPLDAGGEPVADEGGEPVADARGEPGSEKSGESAPDGGGEPAVDGGEPGSEVPMDGGESGPEVMDGGVEPLPEVRAEMVAEASPVCTAGAARLCYTGPGGTAGLGLCTTGAQTCDASGVWGGCKSEVRPEFERCDGKDRDCDGQVAPMASMSNPCVTTLSGQREVGYRNGPVATAELKDVRGLALDARGNLYVGEGNFVIRKIEPDGQVTTYAGAGAYGFLDGPVAIAKFTLPTDLVFDGAGNLYVADSKNHRIRKIDAFGNVSTFAGSGTPGHVDGAALSAAFKTPTGLVLDAAGKIAYVADQENHRIRKIDLSTGVVSTLAGVGTTGTQDGPANTAHFNRPHGLAIDNNGALFVADYGNHRIRKLEQVQNAACGTSTGYTGWCVSTVAGSSLGSQDGLGTAAKFNQPYGLAFNSRGELFVADYGNHTLRKLVEVTNGTCAGMSGVTGFCVSTLAGSGAAGWRDGAGSTAEFNGPSRIVVGAMDVLYVTDALNGSIRKVDSSGKVTTLAGVSVSLFDGDVSLARYQEPQGLAFDGAGALYVVDSKNHRIRKIDTTGKVSTFAGSAGLGFKDGPKGIGLFKVPTGLACCDLIGNLFVADGGNNSIRKVDTTGTIATFAGTSSPGFQDGLQAKFSAPNGLWYASGSKTLYVADTGNHAIRMIDAVGKVSTLAGAGISSAGMVDGPAMSARFRSPFSLVMDSKGAIYVADSGNYRIRKLENLQGGTCATSTNYTGWCVTTIAGTVSSGLKDGPGANAQFYLPRGLAIDSNDVLYVTDAGNHCIRKLEQVQNAACGTSSSYTGWCVSSVSGCQTTSGFLDGPADRARFQSPHFLALDAKGNLHISERNLDLIRVILFVP